MPNEAVTIDTSSFAKFSRTLKKSEPLVAKELRSNLRAAGELVAADMRQRAGFSTRIPGSIKVRAAGSRVRIVAGGARAPGAKPINHGGQGGTFRHPVFGHSDRWVKQDAHPFAQPALFAQRQNATALARRAVRDAWRQAGFH